MRRTLSSDPRNIKPSDTHFGSRFAEACGSAEPARIARLLNISYQAAKNYLTGRMPEPKILLRLAEYTPYSLHWLLTGNGEKLACGSAAEATIPAREIKALIREGCAEVINEVLVRRGEPKVVILDPEKIKSERVYPTERVSDPTDIAS
jgi:hypothetical protein